MRRLWVGGGPFPSLRLLLLFTSLGLGSSARPPGITWTGPPGLTCLLLLPLLGLSSASGKLTGTEEHTIRYNGDVNIGQCSFSLFIELTVVAAAIFTTWTSTERAIF